jgi:hypothetical protein
MSKRKSARRSKGPRFVQLFHYMLGSQAWHQLTPHARCAYIEIARCYDGTNNGTLAMSARRLARLMPCNKDTAAQALHELEDAGFIETAKIGKFARKGEDRRASEYRLTSFRCDATGALPSRKFNPNIRWEPSERPAKPDANVRPNQTSGALSRVSVRPQRTLKPKIDTGNVRPNGTHIDLHHEGGALDAHSIAPSLPLGWRWRRVEKSVVSPDGTVVPIVDHPLVGTEREQAALRLLRRWEAKRRRAQELPVPPTETPKKRPRGNGAAGPRASPSASVLTYATSAAAVPSEDREAPDKGDHAGDVTHGYRRLFALDRLAE